MTAPVIDLSWDDEEDYTLFCPACGQQVAPGPDPCEHVEFIWLKIEPGDFAHVSDGFSDMSETILEKVGNAIDELENGEEVDEEDLSIQTHLEDLDDQHADMIIKVYTPEYKDTAMSDLAYFGFRFKD